MKTLMLSPCIPILALSWVALIAMAAMLACPLQDGLLERRLSISLPWSGHTCYPNTSTAGTTPRRLTRGELHAPEWESPEFVRFVNPSDYRIVEEACGACHMSTIQAAKRSIMATGAMLWGGAAYNNGILPFKNYLLGEAYTREGKPAGIAGPPLKAPLIAQKEYGVAPELLPLPAWETVKPGTSLGCLSEEAAEIFSIPSLKLASQFLGLISD